MTVKSTPAIMEDDSIAYCPVAFVEARHLEPIEGENVQAETWRMKERMKTVSVALVMCLNIGVDPPDVVKPQPCARLECWLDPLGISQQKALETIGTGLQKLYERWQPRARYKLSLDPTVEDVKKLCTSLRRNAKDERVLFHYNGHGVPKPTKNGEIWVFNKSYTQYIPLSIFDLQTWMGAPSIFVWDSNCAGQIIESFKQFSEQHEKEYNSTIEYHRQHTAVANPIHQDARKGSVDGMQAMAGHSQTIEENDDYPSSSTAPNFRECIQLGACRADQILPTNAELPADLFTSSLTTPIKVAVMWYILQNNLTDKIPIDIIDKIPGQLSDRRTLLGELNWIFTAITDTIAWHVLPRDLFQKLFRQDLLVASLFRNFLLADRVMRSYNCSPVSHPELPPTHEHSMWQAWDFALDVCLSQLLHTTSIISDGTPTLANQQSVSVSSTVSASTIDPNATEYTHSPFFAIQLTAFEVWLQYGYNRREPPLQLPIVLQVLLSQVHRIRALELLGRFLDLGSWAVSLALSVGIFPYVLKLLQSSAKELRPLLSFIWAKILAVDSACQQDLIKDCGHRYFLQILSDPSVVDEQKIVSAFVLASILDNYTAGQEAIMQGGFISICMDLLNDCKCSLLRRWITIGLGRLWSDFDAARWQAIRCLTYEKLEELLSDPVPEVRAGAVYALGTLISNRSEQNPHATSTVHSIAAILVQKVCSDGSPLVRQELIMALHWLILNFENQFITLAYELYEERLRAAEKHSYQNQHQQKLKQFHDDVITRIKTNGEIHIVPSSPDNNKHQRQSSMSIADNLCGATLVVGNKTAGDLSKTGSTHNLSSLAPPPAPKLTSVASFSKMISLIGGTGHVSHKQTTSLIATKDELFESKFRSLSISSSTTLGASGNIYATVWRAILNFLDDPEPGVVELAHKLVAHINNEVMQLYKSKLEAEEIEYIANVTESRDILHKTKQITSQKVLDESPSDAARATFVIGSPADPILNKQSPTAVVNGPTKRIRLLTPKMGDEGPTFSIYSTIYSSPRRPVFGSGPANDSSEPPGSKKTGRKPALIETKFLPWCCRRFTEPILHLFDGDNGKSNNDDSTKVVPLTDWALETSTAMAEFSDKEKRSLKKSARLDKQIFVNQNSQSPLCLEFYPLHPLMCVGEQRTVSVWNWELGHFVNTLENHSNNVNGEICFVKVINPLTHGFLMTGTNTGEIRVWDYNLSSYFDWRQPSSYSSATGRAKLLTAWNSRGNDVVKSWSPTSTCYCWEQESALLLVGFDTKVVRVWDAYCELKVQDIPLNNLDGIVKSISSDTDGHHMVAVGCSDGTVRLFDRRLPTNECRLMTLRDLHSDLLQVVLQPKSVGSHVVAGSVDGNVCIWDPRMFRDPVSSFKVCESNITTMDVHPSLELIATSTTNHKVFTTNFCGQSMGVIQYHDGFMGQRLVDISCLKFHPFRINLAVGSVDCILSMYGLS